MKLSQRLRRGGGEDTDLTYDPYWDNVVSLVNFENNTNNYSTICAKGINYSGTTANMIVNTDGRFNNSSCLYLNNSSSMSSALSNLAPGDNTNFTIELSLKQISNPANAVPLYIGNCTNASSCTRIAIIIHTNGTIRFYTSNIPDLHVPSEPGVIQLNTWYDVAAVRNGDNFYLFVDGNLVATTYLIKNVGFANPKTIYFGIGYYGAVRYFNGYIDEIRYTVGIARYTNNYNKRKKPFPTNP
jgi:hypothetical protein